MLTRAGASEAGRASQPLVEERLVVHGPSLRGLVRARMPPDPGGEDAVGSRPSPRGRGLTFLGEGTVGVLAHLAHGELEGVFVALDAGAAPPHLM